MENLGAPFKLRLGGGFDLFLLRRDRQPEHRELPFSGHVQPARRFRIGQIQRLAMLAAIHFRILSPSLRHIAARLLDGVGDVIPAFEMSAAEFAFSVQLIAGALSRFLDFDFVMGKLLWGDVGGPAGFGCGQRSYPRRCGRKTARFRLERYILLEGRVTHHVWSLEELVGLLATKTAKLPHSV